MTATASFPRAKRRVAHDPGQQAWRSGTERTLAGDWPGAAAAFERATAAEPHNAAYWTALALARREAGQAAAALAAARHGLTLEPSNIAMLETVGHCCIQLRRHDEALDALEQLDRLGRRNAELLFARAFMLKCLRRSTEAIDVCLQALALEPAMVKAQGLLAEAFRDLGLKREGAFCYETMLVLDPLQLTALTRMSYTKREGFDWSGLDDDARAIAQALLSRSLDEPCATGVFTLLSLPISPALHLKAARLESRALVAAGPAGPAAAAGSTRTHAPIHAPAGSRIRLGLVSPDFRDHAVSQLLVEVLEAIDRRRFELRLYAIGHDDGSPLHQRLMATADAFVDLQQTSDEQAIERIRDDALDLLVDLAGHTRGSRPALFAQRPAPVQATFLGFPGSSGMDAIDYIVGDPLVTPLALAHHYSEKLAQLPLTLQPNGRSRPLPQPMTRAQAGLPEDAFVMCAFNNTYKIGPEAFDVWCSLLRELPHAVLWLKQTTEQLHGNVRAAAAERGVAPERIVFAPMVTYEHHFSRLALADLFVDTWPYGAHTTASDALWAGLPVVTHYGESYASRVAASVLNAAGIGELAFASVDEYRCAILALALDPPLLATYRQHLVQQRGSLALFDTARYTGELMDLFERMVARSRAGLPCEHLLADARAGAA